jgi:hypothetical protein
MDAPTGTRPPAPVATPARERRPTIVLELVASRQWPDDQAAVRELRRLLKTTLRRLRLRCVSLRQVNG